MTKRKLNKFTLVAGSFLLIAASSGKQSPPAPATIKQLPADTLRQQTSPIPEYTDEQGQSGLPEQKDESLSLALLKPNEDAGRFVRSYLKENAFFLDKIMSRSAAYFTLIDTVFIRFGLPVELKYLAVIESKLNDQVRSPAGAAGLWQLMPAPARQFGLIVNGSHDERRNSYKSTVAAAKCLLYLQGQFNDWMLTLAAYNSGPGRVRSAIKKSGSRNYWVVQKYLPEETRRHVKKFIAIHAFFEQRGIPATEMQVKVTTDPIIRETGMTNR